MEGHVFQTSFSFQFSVLCFAFIFVCQLSIIQTMLLQWINMYLHHFKYVEAYLQIEVGLLDQRVKEFTVFLSRKLLSVGTATVLCLSVIQEHAYFLMDLKRFLKYQIGGFQSFWKTKKQKKNAILVYFFHYLSLLVIFCICESYWKYVLLVSLIALLKSLIVVVFQLIHLNISKHMTLSAHSDSFTFFTNSTFSFFFF